MTHTKGLFFSMAFMVVLSSSQALSTEMTQKGPPVSEGRERYRYEALPVGEGGATEREIIEIELTSSGKMVEYISRATLPDALEVIRIVMDGKGRFLSGDRTTTGLSDRKVRKVRVWSSEDSLFLDRGSDSPGEVKEYVTSGKRHVAVDGSLLMLLRLFPYDEEGEWKVFMVDFSGSSVTVRVRQAGRETITTRTGEFECYRMEVVVDIPLFHPRITYWLTRKEPHFLVKHEGRRGPFTPSYVTSLIAVE